MSKEFTLNAFAEKIKRLQDGHDTNPQAKATIAKIRQCADEPLQHPELFAYLGNVFKEDSPSYLENACFQVACLFALHIEHSTEVGNFGVSLKKLRLQDSSATNSLDLRMNGILSTDVEDLYQVLRPVVMRLKNAKVAINFEQLLKDFCNWNSDRQFVQRNWAKAYYTYDSEQETT